MLQTQDESEKANFPDATNLYLYETFRTYTKSIRGELYMRPSMQIAGGIVPQAG